MHQSLNLFFDVSYSRAFFGHEEFEQRRPRGSEIYAIDHRNQLDFRLVL